MSVNTTGLSSKLTDAVVSRLNSIDESVRHLWNVADCLCTKETEISLKQVCLEPIDGLHRISAILKSSMDSTVPVWWWYRTDKKPITSLDVISIGTLLNELSSSVVVQSNMDRAWNIFQLHSTAVQSGVHTAATEEESLLVQEIIGEGSKVRKRNLHNLVRMRGVAATVKDNQKRKHITLAIGM